MRVETFEQWCAVVRSPNKTVHPVLWAIAKNKSLHIARAQLRASGLEVVFPNPYILLFYRAGLSYWKIACGYYMNPWRSPNPEPDENGELQIDPYLSIGANQDPLFFINSKLQE